MQTTLLRNADSILNYIFGFILVLIFLLGANADDHVRMILGLGLSLVAGILAFLFNWLSLNGLRAAVVLGTAVLGAGGWIPAYAVLLFFLSSSIFSKRSGDENEVAEAFISSRTMARRDGWQVWANGFWAVIFLIAWFIFDEPVNLIAAYSAIAVAVSDTWATEIGCRNPGKTVLITSFKNVQPGSDGGISFKGMAAAVAGAIFIPLALYPVSGQVDLTAAILIAICGFSGSLLDSFLGAKLQYQNKNEESPENDVLSNDNLNSIINWSATGFGAVLAIILTQFLIYEVV